MKFEDSLFDKKLEILKNNEKKINNEKFNYFLLSQNLYETNNPKNYTCNNDFIFENNIFYIKKYSELISNEFFEINPLEKLYFSFETKGINSPLPLFVGFIGYDENFQEITDSMVSYFPETFTKLTEELTNQSTNIKVKNVSKFSKGFFKIAFFTKKNCEDIPNKNLFDINIKNINLEENEIILKHPIKIFDKIPIGTGIRIHQNLTYFFKYPVCFNFYPNDNWNILNGVITSFQTQNDDQNSWRNGTKYAKIVFLVNYEDKNDEKITLIRNIKIFSKN